MSILNCPYFRDEEAAHAFLESILWSDGAECPHCGAVGTAYKIAANSAKRVRYGLWKCSDCRKQLGVDDFSRTMTALLGVKGKRLMYSQGPQNGEGAV